MTNNTFNLAAMLDAQKVYEVAEKKLEQLTENAFTFMIDYIKGRDGEAVSVQELSAKTGISPTKIGIGLSRRFRRDVTCDDYELTKLYVELDEDGQPMMDKVKKITRKVAGYKSW